MKGNIQIYTDGSYDPQKKTGGWAAIILHEGTKNVLRGIASDTSQHRMELTAVLKALEFLKNYHLENFSVSVYSDSQYVVELPDRRKKLESQYYQTRKGNTVVNEDLIRLFFEYIDRFNLDLIKVASHTKAHEGLHYNREADKISRQIVRKGFNPNHKTGD